MKKKFFIFEIVVILILLCLSVFLISNKSGNNINKKASQLFGNDYCQKNDKESVYENSEHSGIAGMAFTLYTCEICNQKYEHPNTAIPKICSTCATSTNRCQYCGKLENSEAK